MEKDNVYVNCSYEDSDYVWDMQKERSTNIKRKIRNLHLNTLTCYSTLSSKSKVILIESKH